MSAIGRAGREYDWPISAATRGGRRMAGVAMEGSARSQRLGAWRGLPKWARERIGRIVRHVDRETIATDYVLPVPEGFSPAPYLASAASVVAALLIGLALQQFLQVTN